MQNLAVFAPVTNSWVKILNELRSQGFGEVKIWVGPNKTRIKSQDFLLLDPYDAVFTRKLPKAKFLPAKALSDLSGVQIYNMFKILDRYDLLGRLSFGQRDAIVRDQFTYWRNLLEDQEIDQVIFSTPPHMPYDYAAYEMGKLLGAQSYYFHPTPILGWHRLRTSIALDGYSKDYIVTDLLHEERSIKDIESVAINPFVLDSFKSPWYMESSRFSPSNKTKTDQLLSAISNRLDFLPEVEAIKNICIRGIYKKSFSRAFEIKSKLEVVPEEYGFFERRRLNLFNWSSTERDRRSFRRKLRNYYDAISTSILPASEFIYFPLQYQPEATTAPLAHFHADQLSAIELVSQNLPKGVNLVVKEHPLQFSSELYGEQGRTRDFYERLSEIDHVCVVSMTERSDMLIEKCIGVATLTGTPGWEAMVNGKNCIYFGNPWYAGAPGSKHATHRNIVDAIDFLMFGPRSSNKSALIEFVARNLIEADIHGISKGLVSENSMGVAKYLLSMAKVN